MVVFEMGRRRRKVIKRIPRRVPVLFTCPSCGNKSVKIMIDKSHHEASVRCGNCGINSKLAVGKLTEQVDVYGEFIDSYYASKK
ncbi:MAG: hypothetical protein WED05_03665 [Candidatus Atabeyarchaeum deiterrae]|jgi:transcription elongation factor Elf1